MNPSFIAIEVIVRLIFAGIAVAIASAKGRSTVGWFFGGFFLWWIGCIIVAVLPNLKEKKVREEAIERDNRRLREQIFQEQVKSESFRRHTTARLDSHDVHLGIDTRAANTALTGPAGTSPLGIGMENWPGQGDTPFNGEPNAEGNGAPHVPPGPQLNQTAGPGLNRQWYYDAGGQACGPIDESSLLAMIRNRQITSQSLLWTELLGDWKIAGDIAFLRPWLVA